MKNIFWALAFVLVLAVASFAGATSLPIGTILPISTVAANTFTTLDASSTEAFNFGLTNDTGTVQEAVVTGLSSNPFTCAGGCLSFVYQIKVATGEVDAISMSSYAGFLIDAVQTKTLSGIPGLVSGSILAIDASHNGLPGDTIAFNYPVSALHAASNSYVEIINTNASNFTSGVVGLIDSGSSPTLTQFYAPSVPEPSMILLMGSGLMGMGLFGRWRSLSV